MVLADAIQIAVAGQGIAGGEGDAGVVGCIRFIVDSGESDHNGRAVGAGGGGDGEGVDVEVAVVQARVRALLLWLNVNEPRINN